MPQIVQTEVFRDWLTGLKDRNAVQRVAARVERMKLGNLGDVKPSAQA